jgi:hypothetical protein
LLITDINIRWLASKTVLIACYNRSQAGQSFLLSFAHRTLSLTWEQPYDRTTPFFSFLVVRFRTAALFIRRLTILALNTAYVGNICFNYRKLGYYLLDCLLFYISYVKLKKLKELLKSDLKNNKYLTNETEKNTF